MLAGCELPVALSRHASRHVLVQCTWHSHQLQLLYGVVPVELPASY